jgi:hypothetical protein
MNLLWGHSVLFGLKSSVRTK